MGQMSSPNWREVVELLNNQTREFNKRFDEVVSGQDKLELRVMRNNEKLENWVTTLNSDALAEHDRIRQECEERAKAVEEKTNERVDALYKYSRWLGSAVVIGLLGLLIDLVKNYISR